MIFSQIDSYISDNNFLMPFFRDKILNKVAEEFNVLDKIKEYDPYLDDTSELEESKLYMKVKESLEEESINTFDIYERKYYNFVKKVFKNALYKDEIFYDSYTTQKKRK